MKVYFVRHGQSEGNSSGIHQDMHTKLSRKGEEQAKIVAERIKNLPIEVVFASDYVRAYTTAKIITDITGHKVKKNKLLREAKRPTEVEGQRYDDESITAIKESIKSNSHNPAWKYSDEESFFDVSIRVHKLLEEMSNRKEQHILCVAHGGFIIATVLTVIMQKLYSPGVIELAATSMAHENTGITVLEYKDKKWTLLTWNDYAHLDEM